MADSDRYGVQLLSDFDALEVEQRWLELWEDEGVVKAYRMRDGEWCASNYYRESELHRRNATRHSEMAGEEEWRVELERLGEDRLEHGLFKCEVDDDDRRLEAQLRFNTGEDMQAFADALRQKGFEPDTQVTDYGHRVLTVSRPLVGD